MKRPPIEGLPPADVRPRCPNCSRMLRPHTFYTYDKKTYWRREFSGAYHRYGAFCTLRCCKVFANAAHLAGYRVAAP